LSVLYCARFIFSRVMVGQHIGMKRNSWYISVGESKSAFPYL